MSEETQEPQYFEGETLVREFSWNNRTYKVANTECDADDMVRIMSAIIGQAVKDFERLAYEPSRRKKVDKEAWETARAFLFDDDYSINYGDTEITFTEMLNIVGKDEGLSITSMRRSLIDKTFKYWETLHVQLPEDFHKQADYNYLWSL